MRVLAIVLALAAAGCGPSVVTVRSGDLGTWFKGQYGLELTQVIKRFEPGKGAGAAYRVGEAVRFVLNLDRQGHVAVISLDLDAQSTPRLLGRYFLAAGDQVLPPPGGPSEYRLSPPAGWQRVRVIFTDRQGPSALSARDGDAATAAYIRSSGATVFDVAETYLVIR
ncbi:DUF4384 domain-containing protein [Calidithermus chliarophilus]|uniref:DUF4384 domain-containing protein n=1 Tax=Calidithermus chliarophilus TaxID=52023 RepID=UPI00040DFD98|nr:DUF4384 domain-containing protein [Calidithermus chliarophilus]